MQKGAFKTKKPFYSILKKVYSKSKPKYSNTNKIQEEIQSIRQKASQLPALKLRKHLDERKKTTFTPEKLRTYKGNSPLQVLSSRRTSQNTLELKAPYMFKVMSPGRVKLNTSKSNPVKKPTSKGNLKHLIIY